MKKIEVLFKAVFIIIGLAIVFILYRIDNKKEVGDYVTFQNMVINTKTGHIFYHSQTEGWYYKNAYGEKIKINSLPTLK